MAEKSESWNIFWTESIVEPASKIGADWNDWTRFRVSRVLKIVLVLSLLAIVLAAYYHTSPFTSLFQAPAALYSSLPLLAQLAFAFVFVLLQFVGLFWFLSKGGIDVYFPGDIKTRFTDVWGQDSVLDRVKENIIFLKDPDSVIFKRLDRISKNRIESCFDPIGNRPRKLLRSCGTALLEDNRVGVLSVAHALESTKTLTGEDVMAILNKSQGPLVDGTIYKDPDFIARLEKYHTIVAEAHRSHKAIVGEFPSADGAFRVIDVIDGTSDASAAMVEQGR